jgi:hypothetical protein
MTVSMYIRARVKTPAVNFRFKCLIEEQLTLAIYLNVFTILSYSLAYKMKKSYK